jgi:hypothetical protein
VVASDRAAVGQTVVLPATILWRIAAPRTAAQPARGASTAASGLSVALAARPLWYFLPWGMPGRRPQANRDPTCRGNNRRWLRTDGSPCNLDPSVVPTMWWRARCISLHASTLITTSSPWPPWRSVFLRAEIYEPLCKARMVGPECAARVATAAALVCRPTHWVRRPALCVPHTQSSEPWTECVDHGSACGPCSSAKTAQSERIEDRSERRAWRQWHETTRDKVGCAWVGALQYGCV